MRALLALMGTGHRGLVSSRTMRLIGAVVLLVIAIGHPGVSQTAAPALELHPAPPPDWRGASVSADTGRMRPGHQNFDGYDPEQCLRAVLHVQSHLYRHTEQDTLQYTARGDTLPTVAIDTGRVCSAKFHEASVPVHQFGSLIRLQLAVNEDDRAAATVTRWLAMDLSADDRAEALYTIASAYILASPMRLDAARAIVATIDSMGPSMAVLRVRVHTALLGQWARQFNTAEIRKEAEGILTIAGRGFGKFATVEERLAAIEGVVSAFRHYAQVLIFENGRGQLDSLRNRTLAIASTLDEPWAQAWVAKMVGDEKTLYPMIGQPFPAINPEWTINGGSHPHRPRTGRVTIVATFSDLSRSVVWNRIPQDYGNYAVLRRLADRYGARGLDVVIVTQTKGYSIGSLVQTEKEELKSMEDLYINFQKIPATILVQKTSFNKLPDGRLIPELTPFMKRFWSAAFVVDQDGVVRWFSQASDVFHTNEAQIDAYVELLLSPDKAALSN